VTIFENVVGYHGLNKHHDVHENSPLKIKSWLRPCLVVSNLSTTLLLKCALVCIFVACLMRILRLVFSNSSASIQSLLVEDVDQCFPTFLGLPHPTAD